MEKPKLLLAIFDLDGTVTKKDTLLEFIRFVHGSSKLRRGLVLLSPAVIISSIGLITSQSLKEIFLSYFFKGMLQTELVDLGDSFGEKVLPAICRSNAIKKIRWHKEQGHSVVILTASCDLWLKKWSQHLQVMLVSSEMEFNDNRATGKLKGNNCKGKEKAIRLKQAFNLLDYSYIYAYGNSKSDRHYYELANEFHHKAF